VRKTLETKPQLIQISAAWNSREGAPLGRNQCVELEIKKPRPNGASTKLPANQKPCDKMAEAIVMSALSKRVGRDHTTVSRQVAKFETMKLIRLRYSTRDHRLRESVVTKKGRRAVIALERARNELMNEVLSQWSSKERTQLALLAHRFVDALSQFASETS
jgi:DNA-binding MarR family transcriptional regulator